MVSDAGYQRLSDVLREDSLDVDAAMIAAEKYGTEGEFRNLCHALNPIPEEDLEEIREAQRAKWRAEVDAEPTVEVGHHIIIHLTHDGYEEIYVWTKKEATLILDALNRELGRLNPAIHQAKPLPVFGPGVRTVDYRLGSSADGEEY